MTARDKKYYEAFMRSNDDNLYKVYGRASYEKWNIFERWHNKFYDTVGAYRFRIITHNSFVFTMGWMMEKDNKKIFTYVTPSGMTEVEVA